MEIAEHAAWLDSQASDAISDEIQRSTGGRRREFESIELSRWSFGVCIKCGVERLRPRSRYCSERCRRARNEPGNRPPGGMAERKRREHALTVTARDAFRASLLSWYTYQDSAPIATLDELAASVARGLLEDVTLIGSAVRAGRVAPGDSWATVEDFKRSQDQ